MLFIGWTTVAQADEAERLAKGLLAEKLAVCVQCEGPLRSHFYWEGAVEAASEYRLTVKFLAHQQHALESWLAQHHPYTTPEWLAVRAEIVSEKYLSWAHASSSTPPL